MQPKDTQVLNSNPMTAEDDDVSLNHGLDQPEEGEATPPASRAEDQQFQFAITEKFLQNDASAFDTTPYPEDVQVIDGQAQEIETSLEGLIDLLDSMRTARGMAQSFAHEAERLVPGILEVPVGYFTKEPTATRYKRSMESLFAKVWEFILETLRKIRQLIRKVVYWVIGQRAPKEGASAEELKRATKEEEERNKQFVKTTEHTIEGLQAKASTMENVVRRGVEVKTPNQEPQQLSSLDRLMGMLLDQSKNDLLGKNIVRFMQGNDAFFNDFIAMGPYSKEIFAVNQQLTFMANVTYERIQALNTTIAGLVLSKPGDQVEPVSKSTIALLTSGSYVDVGGQKYTLDEFAKRLAAASQVREGNGSPKSFMDVYGVLTKAYRRAKFDELSRFVSITSNMLISSDDLLDQVITQLDKAPLQNHEAETNVNWNDVVKVLREEVMGYGLVLAEVRKYRDRVKRMVHDVILFGFEVAEAANEVFTDNEMNQEARTVVRALADEARHGRDDLTKLLVD